MERNESGTTGKKERAKSPRSGKERNDLKKVGTYPALDFNPVINMDNELVRSLKT